MNSALYECNYLRVRLVPLTFLYNTNRQPLRLHKQARVYMGGRHLEYNTHTYLCRHIVYEGISFFSFAAQYMDKQK